jgi:phosphoribosylamine--glycine ligase
VVAQTLEEAEQAVRSMMEEGQFGASGAKVVIEECMTGPEVTVLAFTDGKTIKTMPAAQDHKRVYDNDEGPNTGGMGVIAPNPHYTDETADLCEKTIFLPTIRAMQGEGCPFKGCLYFGLMLTPKGPAVIEYNCRFGDPETQVVLPLLETDLLDIMESVTDGRLGMLDIRWHNAHAACVVLASGGYPSGYETGFPISGLDANGGKDGAVIYHAGTRYENGLFLTAGGRVLGVSAAAPTLNAALEAAYSAAETINFEGKHYRKDIGKYI